MARDINGYTYSHSSILININGILMDAAEISYSSNRERGSVFANSSGRVGRTRGQLTHEGSITFYKKEYDRFRRQLSAVAALTPGASFADVPFAVTVTYGDYGQPTITDTLIGCLVASTSETHAEGTEALRVSVTLDVMDILYAGVSLGGRPLV